VIGYCWGGFLSWLSATRLSGLSAAVSYYARGIGSVAHEQPMCPVLMHFGEKDHAIPSATSRRSAARTRVALRSTFTLQVTASIAMSAPATMPGAPEPPVSARFPSSTGIQADRGAFSCLFAKPEV
jgi:dienelactone hydrolase